MKYIRFEKIRQDAADIPDAIPFVTYREKDEKWAFAMRINNTFTLSQWNTQDCDKSAIKQAKKQILFCQKYGWSYLGMRTWNIGTDDNEPEFKCLYCGITTYVTTDPCPCRNTTLESMLKKTPSGFYLPI